MLFPDKPVVSTISDLDAILIDSYLPPHNMHYSDLGAGHKTFAPNSLLPQFIGRILDFCGGRKFTSGLRREISISGSGLFRSVCLKRQFRPNLVGFRLSL